MVDLPYVFKWCWKTQPKSHMYLVLFGLYMKQIFLLHTKLYIQTPALHLTVEVALVYFFFKLISQLAHSYFNFTMLQVTKTHMHSTSMIHHHRRWLTPIIAGFSRIDSSITLRPGTQSNRLGPDQDLTDCLKYEPKLVQVLGLWVWVWVDPWRPVITTPLKLPPSPAPCRDLLFYVSLFVQ